MNIVPRVNYYTGPTVPKTRLDKPTLHDQRFAYQDRYDAILAVLQAYSADRLALTDHEIDNPPDLDKAIDALTEAQAKLRDVLARRAAPAKRVPR